MADDRTRLKPGDRCVHRDNPAARRGQVLGFIEGREGKPHRYSVRWDDQRVATQTYKEDEIMSEAQAVAAALSC